MPRIAAFIKREATFCIALAAAAASCFFVPPDAQYLAYIDFRTLALLYCLMLVVAGLRKAGVFAVFAQRACRKADTLRRMGLVLVSLSFFSSMLVTNDVAILSFVPLSLAVLARKEEARPLAYIAVLQTVAANLGSMLTPVGNPQNLYLYSYYAMDAGSFFSATGLIWLLSALLLAALCLLIPSRALAGESGAALDESETPRIEKRALAIYAALLCVSLAVVFRLLPWPYMLIAVVAALLFFDRRMLLAADFFLLLTFVCFFVFAGNLARIGAVNALLRRLLSGRELLVAAGASQLISNVPAAILLSGFTDNARALLLGVDIGGLGTPVASLASLIALKLYSRAPHADMKRFCSFFLAVNFLLLAVLLWVASALLG